MWLTRLAFWYLPNPRFYAVFGLFWTQLDPSLSSIAAAKSASGPRLQSIGAAQQRFRMAATHEISRFARSPTPV